MNKLICFTIAVLFFFNSRAYSQTTHIEAENWIAMFEVQTETTSDAGGGLNVGWIDPGDWMDYSYTAPTAGMYNLRFRVATSNSFAQFQIKVGSTVLGTVNVPATGGFQTWQTVTATITLSAGTQTLRLLSSSTGKWNINWWELDAPVTNQSPSANAGTDQTITLPTNSVTVNGSGTDPDGTIASYAWTKVSGGTATITSPSSASTSITGLVQGVYVFRLTVSDNGGATATDDVQITVNAAANQPPSVNAGVDQIITLPTNSVQLNGSATDADGTIASRSWSKVSGPASFTFSSTSVLNPIVSNLVQGAYTFRLTVTDNLGASSSDDILITVNGAASGTWTVTGNATSANDFIGTTNAADLIFKTNNIQQAKITSTGEFWARKIKVTQSGWADYVFDSTYRLRPIAEVKSYIQQHKHLPDVPSASQIKEEGLNLGDGQALLLRKIEELTLYIIGQQEELKKQAAQIKDLQKKLEQRTNNKEAAK